MGKKLAMILAQLSLTNSEKFSGTNINNILEYAPTLDSTKINKIYDLLKKYDVITAYKVVMEKKSKVDIVSIDLHIKEGRSPYEAYNYVH